MSEKIENKYLQRLKDGEDAKTIILEMSITLKQYQQKISNATEIWCDYCESEEDDFDAPINAIDNIMSALNNGNI